MEVIRIIVVEEEEQEERELELGDGMEGEEEEEEEEEESSGGHGGVSSAEENVGLEVGGFCATQWAVCVAVAGETMGFPLGV